MKNGIVKRGNRWAYVIRIPDPKTGKTKPKWVGGFVSEGEAKLAKDKARGKLASGTYVKPTKITVEQYLNEWIEIHSHSLKQSTAQSYRGHIKRNLVPYLGKIALSDLRASHIQRLYADLLSKGNEMGNPLSARSVEFAGSVLSKALKHAVEIDELIAMNPATRVSKPRVRVEKMSRSRLPNSLVFSQMSKDNDSSRSFDWLSIRELARESCLHFVGVILMLQRKLC